MFRFFFSGARDARALTAVRHVATRVGRGVHKRIDENRELLELLQARCPAFLVAHPWVEGWLASHDDFFTELARAVPVENPHAKRNREVLGYQYPRPWPGRLGSIVEKEPGSTT